MNLEEGLEPQDAYTLLHYLIPEMVREYGGVSHTTETAQPLIAWDFTGQTERDQSFTLRCAHVLDTLRYSEAITAWYYVPKSSTLDRLMVDFIACVSPDEAVCIQTTSTERKLQYHRTRRNRFFGPFSDNDHPIVYIFRQRDESGELIPEDVLCDTLLQDLPTIQRIPLR